MAKDYRETLYTVDAEGRRKWVYTSYISGFFAKRRQIVAYLLLALYLLMPWISIGGKQGILLNFASRRFIFFGVEYWATDTYLLFLVLAGMAFTLFFFTALLGRVWCGWACPETVFLEFLFRPIERWIEGSAEQRRRLDKQAWTFKKIRIKLLKHGVSALLAWIIASSFLAYFIGREPLIQMMSDWPHKNPGPFFMTLALMGLMAFQFGWFREQFCTLLCPYARFQSVLMDSNSLIVGYDVVRGEPRGKKNSKAEGDCVDCGLCVRVCPTGIDIRNGLQLECIACAACADACDSIMSKVGREQGLIRYDTENKLLGRELTRQLLRVRPFIYGALVLGFFGTMVYLLGARSLSEFQVLRGSLDKPYSVLADNLISNHFHVRVSNKGKEQETYTFKATELDGSGQIDVIVPQTPFNVLPGKMTTTPLFVNFHKGFLHSGKKKILITISGQSGYQDIQKVTLLGPGE